MNKLAVDYAQACSDSLIAASRAQGAALAAVMNSLKAQLGDAQNRSMTDTAKRLKISIDQLTAQIKNLQKGTGTILAYPEVMIDFPEGKDDNTSAECFSKNFHKLQDIVDNLSNEIMNSKHARETALQMLATVKQYDGGLDTSSTNPGVDRANQGAAAAAQRRAPVQYKGGIQGHGESDITGTENLQKQK